LGIFDKLFGINQFINKDKNKKLTQLEKALEEINLIKLKDSLPSRDELIESIKSLNNKFYHSNEIHNFILNIESMDDSNLNKVNLYTIGVLVKNLNGIRDAIMIFNWCVMMDKYYFQGYLQIGDCNLESYKENNDKQYLEKALQYYKTSIYYCEKNYKDDGYNTPKVNYLGGNYFKIGICYRELGKMRIGKSAIIKARNMVTDGFSVHQIEGYGDWSQILETFKLKSK